MLSVRPTSARCRVLNSDLTFTFRGPLQWTLVPGEIATVTPARRWTSAGNAYLSGGIETTRLDAKALGLVPLRLESQGLWDPAEHYWGKDGKSVEYSAKPIVARGPRPAFEMEQVLPGSDPDDPFSDPIGKSNDLGESGDWRGARKISMELCEADLRCLDAHSHLGNMVFHGRPEDAVRHYEGGFRIGELALGDAFEGVLPWGWIDNRPFLRCMHGFGLCLWRLRRFAEATDIFERMIWLNPTDNQGARCLIPLVRARKSWVDE